MADEKSEKDMKQEPEKGPEDGKGNAGDIDPEVAGLMNDPEGLKKVLVALKKANKEAETRRIKADADEKKALEEQGKFKELAERKDTELKTATERFQRRAVDSSLQREAELAGALDADAIVALAVRSDIGVDEDFAVTGAKEAVEALKKTKPALFGVPDDKKVEPPPSGMPAPRAGFVTGRDITKMSARELIEQGLKKK